MKPVVEKLPKNYNLYFLVPKNFAWNLNILSVLIQKKSVQIHKKLVLIQKKSVVNENKSVEPISLVQNVIMR